MGLVAATDNCVLVWLEVICFSISVSYNISLYYVNILCAYCIL